MNEMRKRMRTVVRGSEFIKSEKDEEEEEEEKNIVGQLILHIMR